MRLQDFEHLASAPRHWSCAHFRRKYEFPRFVYAYEQCIDDSNLPSGHGAFRGQSPAIGSSDSSDAGSDLDGLDLDDEATEREGTGKRRASAMSQTYISMPISVSTVVGSEEAGLGGGLDQAEEARAGITDEEIAEHGAVVTSCGRYSTRYATPNLERMVCGEPR